MITLSTLIAFTLLNMSFALIPGPDVICILSNALTRGARAGYFVCLGIATACLFHVACAAIGLTVVLAAIPSAFLAIKVTGAIYLAWLGWRLLRHPADNASLPRSGTLQAPFLQGVLSNLFNPKIAIFFIAVLPQFIHPDRGHANIQAAVLGLVSVVSGTAVNLVTASLGARARRMLQERSRIFQRVQQAAGCLLMGLAARLVLEKSA